MSNKAASVFFDQKFSESYDERNRNLSPVFKNLHFLIGLVLADLPDNSHILCVGVGTGEEIVALSGAHPGWQFTGIEPSAPMAGICGEKIQKMGLADRCTILNGYLSDFDDSAKYDAILCLLVTHFIIDHDERQSMFNDMYIRLKSGGYLINADISDDMDSPEFQSIFGKWKVMHKSSGASEQNLEHMEKALATQVAVVSKNKMESFLRVAGFTLPVQFFQSLLIRAWYSKKDDPEMQKMPHGLNEFKEEH